MSRATRESSQGARSTTRKVSVSSISRSRRDRIASNDVDDEWGRLRARAAIDLEYLGSNYIVNPSV